jgi:uncharacterized MnhB-related membrane protein
MSLLIAVALTLVLIGAVLVVFTQRTDRQAVLLAVYGLLLTFLFMTLMAPDVALSQLAVGSAVVPLIVLLAIRKIAAIRTQHVGEAATESDDADDADDAEDAVGADATDQANR